MGMVDWAADGPLSSSIAGDSNAGRFTNNSSLGGSNAAAKMRATTQLKKIDYGKFSES